MKNRIDRMLKISVALLIGITLFVACDEVDGDYSEIITMVPADAAVVVDIDVKSLRSKLPSMGLQDSLLYDLMSDEIDDVFVSLIYNDTSKTGVNYDELVMFVQSDQEIAVAAKLDNATDFESFLLMTAQTTDFAIEIELNDEVKSCVLDSNLVLVWNQSKALIMKGNNLNFVLGVFNQDISQSVVANKDFADFYAHKEEIAVWMNMENYMQFVGNMPQLKLGIGFPIMDGYEQLYKGMYSSYNVSFMDGEVVVTGKMTPLNKARKVTSLYYKDQPSKKLLSVVPGDSFLLFSAALDFSEFLKLYASMPQLEELLSKPETEEIVASIEGDIVFSISDFASGPLPIPNAVIALSVSDHTVMESLLNIEGVQKVEKEGYTALLVQMFQVFVAQQDDILLITTDEKVVKSFALGEVLENNLTDSKHNKTVESVMYYYMNLDLESYPLGLTGLLRGKMGNEYNSLSQTMCFEDVTSWFEPVNCEVKSVIILKDKEVNSLDAIFNMIKAVVTIKAE